MPSSQRPFFLSSFFAAFRPQAPTTTSLSATSSQPPSKNHTHAQSTPSSSAPRSISTSASPSSSSGQSAAQRPGTGSVMSQIPLHSPRTHAGMPIPAPGRRRGSDSSSEGFRDVLGGEKWYIGGRTAGGEEKFFKLGVVRRVRSNDRLSLDRLSL